MDDDIDTSKVVIRENTYVEYQSVTISPGARVELQIDLSKPMTGATLYLSLDIPGADVLVEQVAIGNIVVVAEQSYAADWKRGRILKETASPAEALKILLVSQDSREVKVGASFVATEKPGFYSLSNKD